MPCGHRSGLVARRQVLRVVGGWVIFGAAVGLGVSCGQPPQTGNGAGPTPTPDPTPTPTPGDCGCSDGTIGSSTGLLSTDIPVDGVAYRAAGNLFVCHDAGGFFAMTSLCTHAGNDIGIQPQGVAWKPGDLAFGFHCQSHGSDFNANGAVTGGPAVSPLRHFRMSIAMDGTIWVDITPPFADAGCRC